MAEKRHLKIKTDGQNCEALKDSENVTSNNGVSEKNGVPKNTLSTWLKFC